MDQRESTRLGLRDYGPGRFRLMIDEYVYNRARRADGIGAGSGRSYVLMKGPFVRGACTPGLTRREHLFLQGQFGVIMFEDADRAILTYYAHQDARDMDLEWAGLVAGYGRAGKVG